MTIEEILLNYWTLGIIFAIAILFFIFGLKNMLKRRKKIRKINDEKEIRIYEAYNYVKSIKGFSWNSIRQRWISKYKITSAILVNMELNNGDFMMFVADAKEGGFKYKDKTYVIDDSYKYFVHGSKLYCLDYHESFSLPIKRKLPLKELQKGFKAGNFSQEEITYATNPEALEAYLVGSTIKKVMSGAEFDKWMRQVRLISIIILIIVTVHLLLFAQKSGMLSNINFLG